MRKYIFLPFVIILGILLASCSDTTTNPLPVEETGSIFINSNPTGAQITVDGTNYGTTPDSVTNLRVGDHTVALSLDGYRDTSFTVNVVSNLQSTPPTVQLSIKYATFGPITIYETAGTGVDQPSGIDLSTGNAYAVSGTDKDKVDIYYSTDGTSGFTYLVQSADLYPNLTRQTKFYISSGTNLNDGADSPNSALSGWTNYMGDRESNYVFLYDEDGHYSKLKITGWGGGTSGNPAYVEVMWIYNPVGASRAF